MRSTMLAEHGPIAHAEWRLTVSPESPHFVGHFPGSPIYPGVAVLQDVILLYIEKARPALRRLRAVKRAKFHRVILPGQQLDVHVRFPDQSGHVDVRILSRSQLCATARLCFDEG